MADYLPLLSRAVTDKGAEDRAAIYARARGALERQLRGFDPPLEESAIREELDSLEAVIRQVEDAARAAEAAAPNPALDAAPAANSTTPPDATPPEAIPAPLPASEPAKAERPRLEPIKAEPAKVEPPGIEAATKGTALAAKLDVSRPEASAREPDMPAAAPAEIAPETGSETATPEAAQPITDADQAKPSTGADEPEPALAEPEWPQSVAPPTEPALRPTVRPRIPSGGQRAKSRAPVALFGGLAFIAILVMGVVAFTQRDRVRVAGLPGGPAGSAQTDESEGPKTEGRLTEAEPPQPARPGEAKEAQPVPQPPRPSEPQRRASVDAPRGQASEAPIATTSRAFMVLESSGGGPSQFEGLASWSFQPDPAVRSGKSLRTIVAFPLANLTIDIALSRNADAAVNASHTVMVVFDSGGSLEAVREMSPIEWRERESQAGQPLVGIVVPVQDNVFMLGLDKTPATQARNLEILRQQRWMVFEIRLASGRRGAVLIEKGPPGEKAIAEALAEWR